MPKVTFLPEHETVNAKVGESILDVAIQHGIELQHACGGFCACTTCHIFVTAGLDQLSAIEEDETDRMETLMDRQENSRLGCQAKVTGDVTVQRVNI